MAPSALLRQKAEGRSSDLVCHWRKSRWKQNASWPRMNKRIGIPHVYVAGVLALLVLTGCQKKRPSVPPSAAEAPAITIPSPFPPEPPVAETTTTAPPRSEERRVGKE